MYSDIDLNFTVVVKTVSNFMSHNNANSTVVKISRVIQIEFCYFQDIILTYLPNLIQKSFSLILHFDFTYFGKPLLKKGDCNMPAGKAIMENTMNFK